MPVQATQIGSEERAAGPAGNEILTSAAALVLTLLLAAQEVTILLLDRFLGAHMFIGILIIGPPAPIGDWQRGFSF